MAEFIQNDFSGGMDMLSDDTEIASNSYRSLINGRTRLGNIAPIKDSELLNSPVGNKQALFGVGGILVLIVAGHAYYKVLDQEFWVRIPDFAMNAEVEYIYVQPVTSSTMNNRRVLNAENNSSGSLIIQNQFQVSGTPSGLLCQDGLNQPWLIFYDAASNSARARVTKSYSEWSSESTGGSDDREYVPIGKQMFVFNAKLFIVAPNGYEIYRSVSGRNLDFMVNINSSGNKLATEDLGGARTVSFSCGFDEITYIGPLDSEHFIVATAKNIYAISENFNFTLFGEPTFNTPLFLAAGIVNQFSVSDSRGDKTFIDFEGVKTFNGVQQFQIKETNDPFSVQLSKLLENPLTNKTYRQGICCTTVFDNYNIYSLKTRWGYALAIYDNLRQIWVGLDITDAIKIKQFAITNTEDESLLFAITDSDRVYQLYSSEERATAQFHSRSFTLQAKIKHKTMTVRPVFELGTEVGQLYTTEIVDSKRGQTLPSIIQGIVCGVKPPIIPPVRPDTGKLTDNKTLTLNSGEDGYKLSYILAWDTKAELQHLEIETTGIYSRVSKEQVVANLTQLLTT